MCVLMILLSSSAYIFFSIKTRGVCVGDLSLKTRNTHFPFKHDKWMCDLRLPQKVVLTVNIVYLMYMNGRFAHKVLFIYSLIQLNFTGIFLYFVFFFFFLRYPATWSIFTYHLWISCFNISHVEQSESESGVTQSCPTLCDPMDSSLHQASLCMGFSRQEYWSELPFPSPM